MPRPLKCAVIGSGVIAPTHLASFCRLPDVEVAWICDLVEDKARKLSDTYGVANVTTDCRQIMDDPTVDAVSVCTDHASHVPICVAALDAGKHVLCEKSLAADLAGLAVLTEAVEKHPKQVFSAVFQHRFDAVNRNLKQIIEGGVLGKIVTAGVHVRCHRTDKYYRADEWRGTWEHEGGAVLINQAIHFIDLLAWVTGGVESLCGTYKNLTHGDAIETEDTAVAALRFKCGGLGVLEATCSSSIDWEYTLAVHGTEGSVELRNDSLLKVDFRDKAVQESVNHALGTRSATQEDSVIPAHYGGGHGGQIADFIQAIREERKAFVTVGSAAHAVRIVMGIYASHHSGEWVYMDGPPATQAGKEG